MGLYKTRHGWRFHFQKNGKRHTGSGYKTKKEAREAEAEARQILPSPTAMDFLTVCNLYLDLAEKRFAFNTSRQKKHVIRAFYKTIKVPIDLITPQHIYNYLKTRPTNNNFNAHKKDIGALFTFAKDVLKVIKTNPCLEIKNMPHTPAQKYIPPEKDILKLIAACDPKTDERDLILTILHTGARIDEILRLKWEDVNMEKQVLTRWTRKRSGGSLEPIRCHIGKELTEIFKKRWSEKENTTWVFFNKQTGQNYHRRPKLMHSLCKRAKIKTPFGFHSLRHFIATYLADSNKVSKKTIGALLGHQSLRTTEIYLHSIEQSERDAIDLLDGKFCAGRCAVLEEFKQKKG